MKTTYEVIQKEDGRFVVVRVEKQRNIEVSEDVHIGSLTTCCKMAANLNQLEGKLAVIKG